MDTNSTRYRIVIRCFLSHIATTRSKLFTIESIDILHSMSMIDKVSREIIQDFLSPISLTDIKFFADFCKQTGYPCTEEAFHKGIDPESAPKRKDGTVCLGWRAISAECVYEARAPVIKASISDEGYEILKDFLRDTTNDENPRRRILCSVSLSLFQISNTIDLSFGDVIEVDRLWKLGGDYDASFLVYGGNDIVHVYKFNKYEIEYFSKHTVPDVPIGFFSRHSYYATFSFTPSLRDALCEFYSKGLPYVIFEEKGMKIAILRTDFTGDDDGGDIATSCEASKGHVDFIVNNGLISLSKGPAVQTGIESGLCHRSHGSDKFFAHPLVQEIHSLGVAYTNMVNISNGECYY